MEIKKILLAVILLSQGLQARYHSVKSENQFFDETNRYEFVVACFIRGTHGGNDLDKELKKDIHMLKDMIKSTSDTDPYRKLLKDEVGFLVVDVSRDSVDSLVEKYKVSLKEMPQFLLFKNGKVLNAMSGELAKLVGFISKADLLEFVDDYFGKKFDDILADKAEKKEKDREMQIARYQSYSAYRYPYGGYSPYRGGGHYAYSGHAGFYPYRHGFSGHSWFL